eukprot:GHVP01021409.1.p1 GENE.GHVP01021409.1~~GHVP01021409.1.p1  ORF type:complete len:235 (+),score=31.18 GHVP01021409.1:69-773(+)
MSLSEKEREEMKAFDFNVDDFAKTMMDYMSTLSRESLVEMIEDAAYIRFDPEAVLRNLASRVQQNSECREAINICLVWLVTRGPRCRNEKTNNTKIMIRTKTAMSLIGAVDKNNKDLAHDDITIGRLGALLPGWAAIIHMKVLKAKGLQPFDTNSFGLPCFLEFSCGAYAAHAMGFGPQHLEWSYFFDKKSTKDDIKKFHEMSCNVIPAVAKLNAEAISHLEQCKLALNTELEI